MTDEARAFLDGAVPFVEAPPNPVGRPSSYDHDIAGQVCMHVKCGVSINAVAQLPGMPPKTTIYRWRDEIPEFRQALAEALLLRRIDHIEEMLDVAREDNDSAFDLSSRRIRVLQWLVAHERPADVSGGVPGDNAREINPAKLIEHDPLYPAMLAHRKVWQEAR